ncbi:MAG: copper amine oxidase N-terminal domain-containing protein [Clostridiales bacterium]|nr:copper amine oxidase N-terminal domain-containing protein [Clostridiales bacterium]
MKWKCLFLTVLFAVIFTAAVQGRKLNGFEGNIYINGDRADVLAFVDENDDMFVHLRGFFEAMGAEVGYDAEAKKAEVKYSGRIFTFLQSDSENTAMVGGQYVSVFR